MASDGTPQLMWLLLVLPAWIIGAVWVLYEWVRFQGVLRERTGTDLCVRSRATRGPSGAPPAELDTWMALLRRHSDPQVWVAQRRALLSACVVLVVPLAGLAVANAVLGVG